MLTPFWGSVASRFTPFRSFWSNAMAVRNIEDGTISRVQTTRQIFLESPYRNGRSPTSMRCTTRGRGRQAPPYEAKGRVGAKDEDGRPAESAGGARRGCRGPRAALRRLSLRSRYSMPAFYTPFIPGISLSRPQSIGSSRRADGGDPRGMDSKLEGRCARHSEGAFADHSAFDE